MVSLTKDRSRQRHLEHNWYKIEKEILIKIWIYKINSKKNLKKENLSHGIKHERKQRYDIKGLIIKIKHQVWFYKKKNKKIRVSYYYIFKLIKLNY